MKGLSKKDQAQLHEIFKAVTSAESQNQLNSTSFLNNLDMDPPNRSLVSLPTITTKSEDKDAYTPLDSTNSSKNASPAVPMFSDFKKLFLRKN